MSKEEKKIPSKYLVPIKAKNGSIAGYEFNPSPQMRAWVMLRSDKRNINKKDYDILKKMGWKTDMVKEWFEKFGDHFTDWYQDALHSANAEIRGFLEQVGREKAFQGDYNFWRDMARTHGVISAEQVESKISIGKLTKDLDNLTPEELNAKRDALLQASRALEQAPGSDVAGEANSEGQGSDSDGAGAVEAGSMAVLDASRPN